MLTQSNLETKTQNFIFIIFIQYTIVSSPLYSPPQSKVIDQLYLPYLDIMQLFCLSETGGGILLQFNNILPFFFAYYYYNLFTYYNPITNYHYNLFAYYYNLLKKSLNK